MRFVIEKHCFFTGYVQGKIAPLRKASLPYFRSKKPRERSKIVSLSVPGRKSPEFLCCHGQNSRLDFSAYEDCHPPK